MCELQSHPDLPFLSDTVVGAVHLSTAAQRKAAESSKIRTRMFLLNFTVAVLLLLYATFFSFDYPIASGFWKKAKNYMNWVGLPQTNDPIISKEACTPPQESAVFWRPAKRHALDLKVRSQGVNRPEVAKARMP